MEMKLIEELAGVMARTAIEELEYTHGSTRIRLLRSAHGQGNGASIRTDSAKHVPTPVTASAPFTSTTPTKASPHSMHSVMAGISGTFYGAPAPGEATFVKVGDSVQEGQVIAVIEAMKTLNQIESDVSGRVVRVALNDGMAVTPTTVLFEIELLGSLA